ncbi:MAG TPA: TlpA disulfide reductase family protein [Pyrinomonadaceae bacterium]|jgi:thiol-disulfide isomerase/thioredoxin|nr:TlpA disulfide reductase family protein [Pyrinomonadaceae bacterium]
MKRLLALLLLFATCAGYAIPQSGRRISRTTTTPPPPVQPPVNPEPEIPQPKPAATTLAFLPENLLERKIRAVEGSSFRLADFHGKVLVINLWASWCGPCRQEVPEYENVRKEYAGRDVEFIGLTTEDPQEASQNVNQFVRQTRFGFRLGWADRDMALTLMNGRRSIPQTLVIGAGGGVVGHWVGYARGRNADRLREAIKSALP